MQKESPIKLDLQSDIEKAYDLYQPSVAAIRAALAINPQTRKTDTGMPFTVYEGCERTQVVSFETNGKHVVAKCITDPDDAVYQILLRDQAQAMIRGKGDSALNQIIAYSPRDHVLIMEQEQGESTHKLFEEGRFQPSDKFLLDFMKEIVRLRTKGISIDPDPSNVFFQDGRIRFIDYDLGAQHQAPHEQPLWQTQTFLVGFMMQPTSDIFSMYSQAAERIEKIIKANDLTKIVQ